jgi:methionine-rich copper-binding protein CopC
MSTSRITRWGMAVVLLLEGAGAAHAHAFLDHAQPSVGAAVAAAPAAVQLWFTQPLEPAFSSIQVVDPTGNRVDQGQSAVDPADPTRISIALKPLSPGHYKVIWRALSVDSHVTNGDFSFTVGP